MALPDIFKKSKVTLGDVAVIGFVTLASMLLFFGWFYTSTSVPDVCVVEIDGKEFARYDLAAIPGEKFIDIDNGYGKNTIVIYNDGAEVIYSDCPDGIEVKTGKINASGQSLICLPHRLCVRLEGRSKNDVSTW